MNRARSTSSFGNRHSGVSADSAGSSGRMMLVLETVAFLASLILTWVGSAAFVHPAWSLVSLFNIGWLITLLFRSDPRATALALTDLIIKISTVIALVFIEFGNKIPELAMMGQPGSFASSYVFFISIFFVSYVLFFRALRPIVSQSATEAVGATLDRYANLIAIGFLGFAGLLLLWLILKGLMTGFPLLTGTDRFAYRRIEGDKISVYTFNFKYVITFVLGIITFILPVRQVLRYAATGLTIVFIGVFFLFGDKFFSQITSFCIFLSPYLYYNFADVRKNIVKYILVSLVILTPVFAITWLIYSNNGRMTAEATADRLSGRIVGQGELWFLQARLGARLIDFDEKLVAANIAALDVKQIELYAVQNSLGPNYYSNKYAPNNIRRSLATKNAGTVTYTAALEPLGLVAYGWIGLGIMMSACGLLLALLSTYVTYALKSRSVISAIFASYVGVQMRATLSQGAPWVLFSIYSAKWLMVILGIELLLFLVCSTQRTVKRTSRALDLR